MKSKFILLLIFLFSFFLGVVIEHTRPAFYTNVLEILKNPYVEQIGKDDYQSPSISDKKYETFCGT